MDHPKHYLRDGLVGVIATGSGTAVSLIHQVEDWVRLASVTIGLVIGLLTLWRMMRRGK